MLSQRRPQSAAIVLLPEVAGTRRHSRASRIFWIASLAALFTWIGAGLDSTPSQACKIIIADPHGSQVISPQRAPVIIDEGFRTASRHASQTRLDATHLWLQFDAPPVRARAVILEPVWGAGPASLQEMWGQILPLRNNHVFIYPELLGPHRDQAFTLGVRARFVYRDGTVSAPSLPVFISHAGDAAASDGIGADQIVFALAAVMLLGLWWAFRRESDAGYRIRLAAAIALVSLLFLAVSPALSWIKVKDPSGQLPDVQCHLGDEAQCATYVPDSGPNPLSISDVAIDRRIEVARWIGASAALRVGLILSMVLLMPALIWLLVAPGLRTAQTTVALGASAAGYTLLAVVFYRLSMPSWMSVSTTRAFDLGVLATLNIVAAAVMIIYWSFRQSCPQAEIPSAVVHRSH